MPKGKPFEGNAKCPNPKCGRNYRNLSPKSQENAQAQADNRASKCMLREGCPGYIKPTITRG